MADYLIDSIRKPDPSSKHEGITHVSGPVMGLKPRQEVVNAINSGLNTYYTDNGTKRAKVGVVTEQNGTQYLRTYADGVWTDNLLSLKQC